MSGRMSNFADRIIKWKFFRYCFCGGIAALVDMTVFFSANEIFKLHYLIALAISFTVAAGVNYSLQRKITFKNTYKKMHKQFPVFVAVELVGLLIAGVSMTALVEIFRLWPTLARFISIFIALAYNYTANKKITFNMMK
ncbi:MAG: GtrA family protein [Candidatus Diapherotrites archaeon]|nr:GtrA family protein [Candidatus Diapherotrites archaeon]